MGPAENSLDPRPGFAQLQANWSACSRSAELTSSFNSGTREPNRRDQGSAKAVEAVENVSVVSGLVRIKTGQ